MTKIDEILKLEKRVGIKLTVTEDEHRKTLERLSDRFLDKKIEELRAEKEGLEDLADRNYSRAERWGEC